jgi:hypothetical protein
MAFQMVCCQLLVEFLPLFEVLPVVLPPFVFLLFPEFVS